VAAGADTEQQGQSGWRAQHQAAYHGQAKKVLVVLGADKDTKDAIGMTPLHVAAIRGQVEAMPRVLVQLRVDKEAKGPNGAPPLHAAYKHSDMWGKRRR
jgi:ankyrin repeat protein